MARRPPSHLPSSGHGTCCRGIVPGESRGVAAWRCRAGRAVVRRAPGAKPPSGLPAGPAAKRTAVAGPGQVWVGAVVLSDKPLGSIAPAVVIVIVIGGV